MPSVGDSVGSIRVTGTLGRGWMGEVRRARGEPVGAVDDFAASRKILQQLSALDRNNTEWKLLLAIGESKVADAQGLLGQDEAALSARQACDAELRGLVACWTRPVRIMS